MSLFFIVCTLSLFAMPLVLGYFAGSALLGPIDWAIWTLKLTRGTAPRLLGPGGAEALTPEGRPDVRRLLDEAALAKRQLGARYFTASFEGREIWVRKQPCSVDERGQTVSLPLARDQRKACQYVSSTWILVDLRDVLPSQLHLHLQWMPEENVLGHEGLAAGLLDGDLQPLLRKGDQLLITDGLLGVDSPFAEQQLRSPRLVSAVGRAAHRLAEATENGLVDVPRLLLGAAEGLGAARSRARAVGSMLDDYPEHPEAEPLRARALTDVAPEVRFAAARSSGPAAFDIVRDIVFEDVAADGLRQRALRYLIREQAPAELADTLDRLVRDGPERLRQIAVRHVHALGEDRAVPALLLAANSTDLQTQVDVAEALGRLGGASAEPTLLKLLSRPALAVQIAAAEGLGRLGSLTAVEALLGAGQTTGAPRELRLAALGAVHTIRARNTRTGVGALSLAEDLGAGGLSVPPPAALEPEPSDDAA